MKIVENNKKNFKVTLNNLNLSVKKRYFISNCTINLGLFNSIKC